jgi:integrase
MGEISVTVMRYGDRANLLLAYVDPMSGKRKTRSAKTDDEGEALKAAARWEDELRAGKYAPPSKVTWSQFRERYRTEHLSTLKPRGREGAECALNQVEKLLAVDRLAKLNAGALSTFATKLRQQGSKETTVASVLRTVRAALGWAASVGLLREVPAVTVPKQAKGKKRMKGRALCQEEFDRLSDAVEKVRPGDAEDWRRFLKALWLSGLRLGEACQLSWDTDAPFSIDLSGRRPRFRIEGYSQKSGNDELLLMTPDFAEFLLATPESDRHGRVFRLNAMGMNIPLDFHRVGEIVTMIGEKAGIVVNREMKRDPKTGKPIIDPKTQKPVQAVKYASCHDLRRSFGSRWARKTRTPVLQKLMRHADIKTTMAYYVDLDADAIADELYACQIGESNIFGNISQNQAENAESPVTVTDYEALS